MKIISNPTRLAVTGKTSGPSLYHLLEVLGNLYGAYADPNTIKFLSHQLVTFTNIVSLEQWKHCVNNGAAMRYQRGGPEFMNWASNQFAIYNKTNDPQAWLNWKHANLEN